MQSASKIVRNSLANYAGNATILVVGFLLTPFLIRALGDAGYGAWVLVGSISSYFWLLDFGLGASVTKLVSESRAAGDREKLNAVVATSLALLTAVGLVAMLASWIVAQFVTNLFLLPDGLISDVRTMIYLTGVTMLVSFPLSVFGGVLRGYQRYDLINAVAVVSTVANALCSLVVVKLGLGLVGLSLVGLLTNLLVGGGRAALAGRLDRDLAIRPALVKRSALRDITHFSVWVFVINVATQVVYRTSPIIIAAVLGVALVTPFAIANSLVQYARRFVEPVLAVLLPAYAELSVVDGEEHVRYLFVEGSKIVGAIAMPLALGLVLLGEPFIALWVGPGYAASSTLLYLLVPPLFVSFLVATGDKLLWAKGKVRLNAYVAVVDTVANLSLSLALARILGLPGVALATFLSVLTTNGLWLMPYICREAGLPVRRYLSAVARPVLVPTAPSAALALSLRWLLGTDSYLHLVLVAVALAASYWACFAALTGTDERRRWWSILRGAVSPSRASGSLTSTSGDTLRVDVRTP